MTSSSSFSGGGEGEGAGGAQVRGSRSAGRGARRAVYPGGDRDLEEARDDGDRGGDALIAEDRWPADSTENALPGDLN